MSWENEKEIYELIGKFSIEFEQMCRSMEGCIRNIFYTEGLKNDAYQEIILSGYTAEPLRSLLQKLIGEKIVTTKVEAEICSKVFSKIQNLITERNDILHSKWFIWRFPVEKNKSTMVIGEKLHSNKGGVDKKVLKLTKDHLETLSYQCKECRTILSLFVRCVVNIKKIEECFSIIDKQLVINRQALDPIEIKLNV